MKLLLASSNPGKLREYRELARDSGIEFDLIQNFSQLPPFEESAPTFAENSAGKAMHYSSLVHETVVADDSGLVVAAIHGAPGVRSARYAGPNASDEDRIRKVLHDMTGKEGDDRSARFVCVTSIARQGRILAVVSDFSEGVLTKEVFGGGGFGYDPIFFSKEFSRTYAEITREQKNSCSHRAKAFRKIVSLVALR